mgnify:CR=1 FL=1
MKLAHACLFVLIGLAGISFATMLLWTVPIIQAGSDGAPLLDFQSKDTPVTDVQSYLIGMHQVARSAYLGPQRLLDTVFPVSLALALSLAIVLSLKPRIGRLSYVAAVVPLLYLYVDLLENATVAGLLRAADPLPQSIQSVQVYTELKFLLLLAAGLILLLGLISRLIEWGLGRKRN